MGATSQILVSVTLLFLFGTLTTTALSRRKLQANRLIRTICETLHEDGTLYFRESKQWESICHDYFKWAHFEKHDDDDDEEEETKTDQAATGKSRQFFSHLTIACVLRSKRMRAIE